MNSKITTKRMKRVSFEKSNTAQLSSFLGCRLVQPNSSGEKKYNCCIIYFMASQDEEMTGL
jgi:hypothetical protein